MAVLWESTVHPVRAAGPPVRGTCPPCLELRALPTSLGALELGLHWGWGQRVVGWRGQVRQTPHSSLCCCHHLQAARERCVSKIVPDLSSLKASKCLLEVWAAS